MGGTGVIPPSLVAPQSGGSGGSQAKPERGGDGEVQGCIEDCQVPIRNGSAKTREMNSSRPRAFPADLLVQCPERFKERSRTVAKNAVVAAAKEHIWLVKWLNPPRRSDPVRSISRRHYR